MFKHIARILLGLTFVFSGFVKGIDPWGSTYKFTDYFNAFQMPWLTGLAFGLGILLAAAEFAMGTAMIFNFFIRITSWFTLIFMVFFTGLTLVLALTNPVTDCGCFGDALVITNWQTFYKNIILLALAIFIFKQRKKFKSKDGPILSIAFTSMTMVFYFYLVDYSYHHLPIIDFSPYKVGVNIPDAMKTPEGAPKAIYKNNFVYKNIKTGENQKFTEANYPWKDTLNWQFVKMEDPELIQKGYTPPIHDFRIETPEGEDIKDFFLYDDKLTFILVAYDLRKTNIEGMKRAARLATEAKNRGYNFIALTATSPDTFESFKNETGANFDFFNTDEIALKTIIRSNPGLIILKKGTILKKYHFNDIPKPEELDSKLAE
ncbi:MAG TPA: BT_3928 family protein [Prolixibacteraceae bacterium]|nr:BT_3928 family protein [Prolixibacteraceae bacterium]